MQHQKHENEIAWGNQRNQSIEKPGAKKKAETAYCVQNPSAVIADDVEQVPGVGGDNILPSLLEAKETHSYMIDRS